MFLSDPRNERIMKIVNCLMGPTLNFHCKQNKDCRSGPETSLWMKDNSSHLYMEHCVSCMACLWSAGNLTQCGFLVCNNKQMPAVQQALESTVFIEDEYAGIYGQLATSFHVERLKRGLWLLIGLPWSLQRYRSGISAVWKTFLKDVEIFRKIEAMTDRVPKLQELYRRHVLVSQSVSK